MSLILTSNSADVPFTERYFGALAVTSTTASPDILRNALREQGYLFLRGCLEGDAVRSLRAAYLSQFPASMFKPGSAREHGLFSGAYPNKLPPHGTPGHPAHAFVRSDAFRAFVADQRLQTLADILLGGPTTQLRRAPLRHFVRGRGVASRAHIDYSYRDACSADILTFWIPIGDCPLKAGGIIYLEDSREDACRRQYHRLHLHQGDHGFVRLQRIERGRYAGNGICLGDGALPHASVPRACGEAGGGRPGAGKVLD